VTGPEEPAASQVDVNALIRRVPPGDFLIALGLLLIFAFSFVGGWFHVSYNPCAGLPFNQSNSSCDQSVTYGTLWSGFGVLPALLLIVATLFFVIRKVPQVHWVLPVADSVVWLLFAILEIALFFLYWFMSKGTDQGVDISTQVGTGYSLLPGWTLFVCAALAVAVALGGFVQGRPTPARRVVSAHPPSAAAAIPVGTMSPDRSTWFDGSVWRDATISVPPGVSRSEDGLYWWDGAAWRAVPET
jgi:hypothetical protein